MLTHAHQSFNSHTVLSCAVFAPGGKATFRKALSGKDGSPLGHTGTAGCDKPTYQLFIYVDSQVIKAFYYGAVLCLCFSISLCVYRSEYVYSVPSVIRLVNVYANL